MVAEGPNMNIGIITHDNEIVVSLVPPVVPSRSLHLSVLFVMQVQSVERHAASYPTGLTAVKLLHQYLPNSLACLAQVPPFDSALPGITIMTLMELIPEVHPSCALFASINSAGLLDGLYNPASCLKDCIVEFQ